MTDLTLQLKCEADHLACSLAEFRGTVIAEHLSPFADLEGLKSRIADLVPGPASSQLAAQIGGRLGELALGGSIGDHLDALLASETLRVRLRIDDEIAELPWEFMLLGSNFLALHPAVRLTRDPGQVKVPEACGAEVRILVVRADPGTSTYPTMLGAERELASVRKALEVDETKRVVLEVLDHATPNSLARRLAATTHDVVHIIAHGDVLPSGGVIVLEGSRPGEDAPLYGNELAGWLKRSRTKLVVLSGCLTSGSRASVGSDLIREGIPGVVGMQLAVGDASAHQFARAFYASLADGSSVEEAMFEGRIAIQGTGLDWGAPVLTTSLSEFCPLAPQPPVPSEALRGNLPKPTTSFIGRAELIRSTVARLRTHRCITLHGSGGIGKTRLSFEIARAAAPSFTKGVWLVALDGVTDSDLVLPTIAGVFGIRESAGRSVEAQLMDFLAHQNLLLVLDNCEHLVDACRSVVSRLLRARGIAILTTSRRVLGVDGEAVLGVPSLNSPDLDADGPIRLSPSDIIANFEAVDLFVQRAGEAYSGFIATTDNIEAICRICRRLDGIPLAIELAAARARTFAPGQLLERLGREFELLSLEKASAPDRQRTMRATLDWSYSLLTDDERTVFHRLGVFAGTGSLEAIEEVVSAAPIARDKVLSLLSNLIDNSLVVAEEQAYEMRYRLLETSRAYALEHMADEDLAEARHRHLDFMGKVASSTLHRLRGLSQVKSRAILGADQDNMTAAISWAAGDGNRPAQAGELAKNNFQLWFFSGDFARSKGMIDRVLDNLRDNEGLLGLELRTLRGAASVYAGDRNAIQMMSDAHRIADMKYPDRVGELIEPWYMDCAYMVGDDEAAVRLAEGLIERARQAGNRRAEGYVRLSLGNIAMGRQDTDSARRQYEILLDAKLEERDVRGIGLALCHLAYLDSLEGKQGYPARFHNGLHHFALADDPYLFSSYVGLASRTFLPNEPERAAALQGLGDKMREEVGAAQDRFAAIWTDQIKQVTRSSLENYEVHHMNGRTLTIEIALEWFGATR